MTDEELMECTVGELMSILESARRRRLSASKNNNWEMFQKQGELMLKCEQLLESKT